jgi:hypothetical protein
VPDPEFRLCRAGSIDNLQPGCRACPNDGIA